MDNVFYLGQPWFFSTLIFLLFFLVHLIAYINLLSSCVISALDISRRVFAGVSNIFLGLLICPAISADFSLLHFLLSIHLKSISIFRIGCPSWRNSLRSSSSPGVILSAAGSCFLLACDWSSCSGHVVRRLPTRLRLGCAASDLNSWQVEYRPRKKSKQPGAGTQAIKMCKVPDRLCCCLKYASGSSIYLLGWTLFLIRVL